MPSGTRQAIHIPANAALLLIDIQRAFGSEYWDYWSAPGGQRNNPEAEQTAARLLGHWRAEGRPVFHVKHDSTSARSLLRPGVSTNEIVSVVAPTGGEPLYHKQVNSAFIGTSLERDLRARGIDAIVIAGLTTDHCVSTSARMAGNLGFKTFVVSDATATFDRVAQDGQCYSAELMHDTALASLHGEFATVARADSILPG
ncbi:MAG: cysteine hydrolase family protein [bacterium]